MVISKVIFDCVCVCTTKFIVWIYDDSFVCVCCSVLLISTLWIKVPSNRLSGGMSSGLSGSMNGNRKFSGFGRRSAKILNS